LQFDQNAPQRCCAAWRLMPSRAPDLGPGAAMAAQALDRLGHRGVDLLSQADQQDQGLDAAVSDTAAVGTQDAPDEGAILVVLDLPS
jgi:hypothetical protein